MRVCVIGNSHVVCWLYGWRALPASRRGPFELTFFAALAAQLNSLVRKDGELLPADEPTRETLARLSGGRDSIRIEQYDAFVVVGSMLNFSRVLSCSKHYGTVSRQPMYGTRHLISDACFEDRLDDIYNKSQLAIRLAGTLREMSSAKVILTPTPCISEAALSQNEYYAACDKERYFGSLYSAFLAQMEKVAAASGLLWLPQNPETLALPGFTQHRYSVEGHGLNKIEIGRFDLAHMNTEFGGIMVSDALKMLGR